MNTYIYLYTFAGNEATFSVIADTREEADMRVNAMKGAKFEGILYDEIPVSDAFLRKFTCESVH